MSPVKCLECGLIWPSKSKAGGHQGGVAPHKVAYVCITCSETFAKCKDLHSHQAAVRHKPPQDLGPIMAVQAAAASRAACSASTAGPSHAPAPEKDADLEGGEGRGGYFCPVCYREFETDDDLVDVRSTVHIARWTPS